MDLIADRGRRVTVDELNTSKLLSHAAEQARQRKLDEITIVDVDAHHYEQEHLREILPFMGNEISSLGPNEAGNKAVLPGLPPVRRCACPCTWPLDNARRTSLKSEVGSRAVGSRKPEAGSATSNFRFFPERRTRIGVGRVDGAPVRRGGVPTPRQQAVGPCCVLDPT